MASAAEVAPILRGLVANDAAGQVERFILSFRSGEAIDAYLAAAELERASQSGTVTPDHAIRIKPKPVILPTPEAGKLDAFRAAAEAAIVAYRRDYAAYFERNNARVGGGKRALDSAPRVLLVPGLGIFAAGQSAKDAGIAGDLAETTVEVVGNAERVGRFESISEAELFDMEYWSLEQAKLGKAKEAALARHVAVVTGGAGAIGAAIAQAFRDQGAEVVLLDRDAGAVERVAQELGGLGLVCDVTDDESVEQAFARVREHFGGVDILVSNAGAAWQGRIGEVSDAVLRESFELNFFAHQRVARAAVATMNAQATGGVLLFNVSKQAVNPGPGFGPYGLPKAATLALVRQYALDYGSDAIRSNGVNADRIRSGLLTEDMIGKRSQARGVSEEEYMSGNLLGREVTAADVARAFVDLALARSTTGAIITVDGGNIAAALR